MSAPLKIPVESRPAETPKVPVLGISEWMCYYVNYGVEGGGRPEAIDECVDLHREEGIDALVWNCGRSTVDYWTDLPGATEQCEDGVMVGGKDWSFVARLMERICPLCRAIERCRRIGMPVWGRLCMNRHYGGEKNIGVTSRLARQNPEYHERSKPGNRVPSRLCYAVEEVRRERIEILLEIQRRGVSGLVLDFCRQMPILMYHPALVAPYTEQTGEDPREIGSSDPEDYRRWFQWRADVLTDFMRELRPRVRRAVEKTGRPCPIVARVPDGVEWLMIAYGLDVERWMKEDLIDGTMLSPFPATHEAPEPDTEWHAKTAHRYGKFCIGGIGSQKLIRNGTHKNTGFYHPQPVFQLARGQYAAGVDAMSLYQSETLVRMDYLRELIEKIGSRAAAERNALQLPRPRFPEDYFIGMDWHARLRHSLRTELAGDAAL